VTAHTDAYALRQTLDAYLDTLALAGKTAPPSIAVRRAQFNAWLKTEGVAHYRGVQLVPQLERRPQA
jgi:hypothetical protein